MVMVAVVAVVAALPAAGASDAARRVPSLHWPMLRTQTEAMTVV